jgi:hypothetical protein
MYGELPPSFHRVLAEAALKDRRASSKDISPAIQQRIFYDYPEHFNKDEYEDTKLVLGGVALHALEHLPLERTKRNTELFHFCKYIFTIVKCDADREQLYSDFRHI